MVRIPKTQKLEINLKRFFTKEARKNIIGEPSTGFATYKSLLNKKKGVRFDNAPSNKPSVVKRKGKDHWLVHTGETMRKGILFKAGKRDLLVYASEQSHSGRSFRMTKKGKRPFRQKNPPTYKQIFQWNNAVGYSGIFRQLPVGSQFPKRLIAEVGKQMLPQISKGIKKKYNVKWQ